MSGSHFGDVRVKDVPQSCEKKKSGLLTILIHENAREVKQILPENLIRIYLRITITLQNHMSTEKFYQYLHKKKIFFAICRVALLFKIISLKWVTRGCTFRNEESIS